MDAQSSQASPDVETPRNLFFGVEDRRLAGRAGADKKHLEMEGSSRQKLADDVIVSATQLANAIRTLRAFDRTGDAVAALAHIEHSLEDVRKNTLLLINQVNASVDRYGDNLDLLNMRNAALAAEAMNQAPATPQTPAAAVEPSPQQAPAAVGPTLDQKPNVTPLTLVRSTAFSIISAGLDEAQRNRTGAAK